ncbi:GNAT family N-acetyltransferase [Thermosipho globiformans]|uniref:GNAT family N-acetyltransferase n=1 Tax=Thermosipho globiformans TaxID=380685 RepID=UPI000F8EFD83|nr:GNAT family N-acetyltransferase [Thermosipho globiformans]
MFNTELIIEEISKSDIFNLYEYRKNILSETPFLVTTLDDLMDFNSFKNYIHFYIENDLRNIFVAKKDNSIVGEITILIHDKKRMRHVAEFGISVLKEYRGKGIGKKLIQTAEKWAFDKKVKRIQIEVMENNRVALNLYHSLGYKIEGRKKMAVRFDDSFIDLIIMAKLRDFK